jgi:hypothetical protein
VEGSIICANGAGVCDPATLLCECNDPQYQDASEFRSSTGCAVYIPAYNSLLGIVGAMFSLNTVTSLMAMLLLKRRTRSATRAEMLLICSYFLFGVFGVTLVALQGSSPSRRVGLNLATTVIFAIFGTIGWFLLVLKPVSRSEVSLSRFAIDRTNSIARIYKRSIPLMALLIVSGMIVCPIGEVIYPQYEAAWTSCFFVSFLRCCIV